MATRPGGRVVAVAVLLATLVGVSAAYAGCLTGARAGVLRLGFFPNVTHAQALYGIESGVFEDHLGDTHLKMQSFNAGPTAITALLARRVDVTYVGPSPTITGLEASGDRSLRIIAGSASGGAAFVVREGLILDDADDFHGKKFATPQLGNTQDLALKHYLLERGLRTQDKGGDVQVLNAVNADILSLFKQGRIHGAWVPEPWATRLVHEADGRVLVNEADLWPDGDFVTTQVVTTQSFLDTHGDDVLNLLEAHVNVTQRLRTIDDAERNAINDAQERFAGKRLPDATLEEALANVRFTYDPLPEAFAQQYEMADDLGFAGKREIDLDRVYAVEALNRVLDEAELPRVDARDRGVRVRFENFGHRFKGVKGEVEAVKDFTLDVKAGEFVVVAGPSGCGKSTLLHTTAGLVLPTAGRVLVDEQPVTGPDRSRIMVFQQALLFPWLTVRGNVEYGLARGGVGRSERQKRALEMLKLVQLDGFAKHRVHELSGGMQQRVALARALALEPKVLLMDEPFAALDAQTREELQTRLEELWQRDKPTILFVTHDVHEAARLADRIVVMSHRPGTVKRIIDVGGTRPRAFDDETTARLAREAREALAEEVAWARERELAWI